MNGTESAKPGFEYKPVNMVSYFGVSSVLF